MYGGYYGNAPYMMNGPYMGMMPPMGYGGSPPNQQRLMPRGGGPQAMGSQYASFGAAAPASNPSATNGTSQAQHLARGASFTLRQKDRHGSVMQPSPVPSSQGASMQPAPYPSYNRYGSMASNGFGGYGSFRPGPGMGYMGPQAANTSGYSTGSTNAGSLYRTNSGLGSQTFSYGAQGFMGSGVTDRAGGSFARQSSLMGFGSMGPASSFRSTDTTSNAGEGGYEYGTGAAGVGSDASLQRQDSATSFARTYSIAGQFYNYDGPSGGAASEMGASGMEQRRLSLQPNHMGGNMGGFGPMSRPGAPMMTLNGMNGFMRTNAMAGRGGGMQPAAGNTGAPNPNRRTGKTEPEAVAEGQPQALGRKNSVGNLSRKGSEKRVGMYFKNKESQDDNAEYKSDGDPEVNKREAKKDPSLVNNVKPLLLLDRSQRNPDLDLDGSTVRYQKPGNDEVTKYDMRDVIVVDQRRDIEVLSDSLDEVQQNFVMGNNVGMIMADADCKASDPTSWFTWNALRSVVKNVFGRMQSSSSAKEFTASMCLLQDDQVLDLLADPPGNFQSLTVAESPLFGNVAHGLQYLELEDAGDFNDTLDAALSLAKNKQHPGDEQGIILVTCILKQVRTSQSTGKKDVILSSIFASGVGDGVIHYNRILDKNPAEPRALFYSVLHRSVHSCAIFSASETSPEINTYLNTLERFRKVETRKPKVGSLRLFTSSAKSSIPRVKEELEKAKPGPKKAMLQKHLDRTELMLMDAEDALEDPENCVPKTYV